MQRHHVGTAKDLIQRGTLHPQLRCLFLTRAECDHIDVKRFEQLDDAAADHPQRDDAHAAAVGARHFLSGRVAAITLHGESEIPAAFEAKQYLGQRELCGRHRIRCIGAGDHQASLPGRIRHEVFDRPGSIKHGLQLGRCS